MDFSELITLAFWNGLVKTHLPEIIMFLTAVSVVVIDRYVRQLVLKLTGSTNKVTRFLVFLLVCSIGYAMISLGLAWALRTGFTYSGGLYAAPAVLGVLIIVSIEAQRQRQF